MKKLFKSLVWLIIIAIILVVVGIGVLVTFVSPNRFKPLITAQVLKYTGRQLTIDGNLAWSFFPNLGVKVGHLSLANPEGFPKTPLLEINHANIAVKFLPLLHSKIEADAITISGMRVNLMKDASGKNNWELLKQSAPAVAAVTLNAPGTENIVVDSANKKSSFTFNIDSVTINDAKISFIDAQSHQDVSVNKLNIDAKHIRLNEAFPLKTTFEYAVKNNSQAMDGSATFDADLKLNLEKQMYALNEVELRLHLHEADQSIALKLTSDVLANLDSNTVSLNGSKVEVAGVKQLNNHSVELNSDIDVDLNKKIIKLTHLIADVANLKLQGKATVTNYQTTPQIAANVSIAPFDLKQFLTSIGKPNDNVKVLKNVSGDLNFSLTMPQGKNTSVLQAIRCDGDLKIDNVQAANIKLQEVKVIPQLKDGILNLNPVTANLYQGTLKTTAQVNLNGQVPQIAVQGNLANVQAEPLLADLHGDSKMKLKGAANVEIHITTLGMNADSIVRHLNGTGSFSLKNGVLDGINVGYLVDSAYAFAKQQTAPTKDGDSTPFGTLSGSVAIANGVVNNNDLLLDSPRFTTKGQGDIDLVNQQIHYELQTVSKQAAENHAKNILNVYNLTIPIKIAGDLNHPKISLDTGSILKQIAKQQFDNQKEKIQNQVKNKLQDALKDKLPDNLKEQLSGKAGDVLQKFLGN